MARSRRSGRKAGLRARQLCQRRGGSKEYLGLRSISDSPCSFPATDFLFLSSEEITHIIGDKCCVEHGLVIRSRIS